MCNSDLIQNKYYAYEYRVTAQHIEDYHDHWFPFNRHARWDTAWEADEVKIDLARKYQTRVQARKELEQAMFYIDFDDVATVRWLAAVAAIYAFRLDYEWRD